METWFLVSPDGKSETKLAGKPTVVAADHSLRYWERCDVDRPDLLESPPKITHFTEIEGVTGWTNVIDQSPSLVIVINVTGADPKYIEMARTFLKRKSGIKILTLDK